jgi:hypothetical protein
LDWREALSWVCQSWNSLAWDSVGTRLDDMLWVFELGPEVRAWAHNLLRVVRRLCVCKCLLCREREEKDKTKSVLVWHLSAAWRVLIG